MYSRILVPLDGSELGERALAHARQLASATGGATIHLLQTVSRHPELETIHAGGMQATPQMVEYGMEHTERLVQAEIARAEAYLQQVAAELQSAGINVRTEVREGAASEKILEYAGEQEIDLIVMSTRGHGGIRRLVLGSVTDQVVRSSEVPVLVVPPGAMSK